MAWIDDRIWCHPKFIGLTAQAFSAYVKGLAYSSGMSTNGRINGPTQKLVGAPPRIRAELVAAGLWDLNGDGTTIHIHDWQEHNGNREAKKQADRDRKNRLREGVSEGEWLKARRAVYARDKGVCADCNTADGRWHADHIPDRETLRKQGVSLVDIDYIETRCTSCHSRRTATEMAQKRKRTSTGQVPDKPSDTLSEVHRPSNR